MHIDKERFGGRALVAAVVFFLVSAAEVARFIAQQRWGEANMLGSNIPLIGVPVWLAAGVALVAKKGWAWPLVVLAVVTVLAHGSIIGISGLGLISGVYLVAGFAAGFSVLRHLATYGVHGYAEVPETQRTGVGARLSWQ